MTRRNLIHKWTVYALALVPVWLLDACILPRWPVLGVIPTLLPLAAVAVAVLEGGLAGAGFGMGTGLLWALAYPGGFGFRVFLLALAGMAAGILSRYVLSQSLFGCLICSAGVLAALGGGHVLRLLAAGTAPLPVLLQVAVPEWLVSLAWSPAVYLIFRAVYRKVGGTRLA